MRLQVLSEAFPPGVSSTTYFTFEVFIARMYNHMPGQTILGEESRMTYSTLLVPLLQVNGSLVQEQLIFQVVLPAANLAAIPVDLIMKDAQMFGTLVVRVKTLRTKGTSPSALLQMDSPYMTDPFCGISENFVTPLTRVAANLMSL